ncbi:hypothetical protein C9374_011567 [Naegleria lovaniensis]|uniref:UBA domain-containing protein n=1 Tax=Naegleria lovaniensis TaxID=51637 RepID=A0AA88GE38_NAELO|nr:uncharacterized protein C9374_011567 [Naegleria lovaniensis]KAG2373902.1 hypothetical protein C9374_011567 [Naegleria lovaniensis]
MSSSNDQQQENLIIKLYLSKDHIRRFTALPSSTLEDVKSKVVEFYQELGQQISNDKLDLQYCDSDNEWAILRNEDDWYCCKAICSPNIKIRQANMWMKAIYNYKTQQQALVQKFNKEKKQLVSKGQEFCSQINQELKKLGSNEEVKKFEKAVEDFCTSVVDSITPLLNNAAEATSDLFESAFKGRQSASASESSSTEPSSSDELIRVTEHEEEQDQEEEKAFEQAQHAIQQPIQQQPAQNEENIIERSGFIWVNPTNSSPVPIVQPTVEEVPQPTEVPAVQEPMISQPAVQQEPVAEESVPVVAQQEEQSPVETPYAEQLKMLEVMGFTDTTKNLQLLDKHNGNLALVVDELL